MITCMQVDIPFILKQVLSAAASIYISFVRACSFAHKVAVS